ncbi:S-layer protein Sap [uncultured Eubacteriales bacterium]|uniref:S-layer protein Sap n=1 Tax=uncultured Eubacteriales bacterium TaxID=172733 RepID=A0A212KGE2_9FIRM|nr:S-layer protein Sap [uncultured Eubacteriales bacterium]
MKGKKLLSWVLAAALCLPGFTLPAMAASFPDVVGHWAVDRIDDAVAKGIFVGIEGKFVPDRTITASEVLAVCARITVDSETRTDIGADRADQIKGLMGDEQSWFHKEYAVCLEAGILTYAELKELYQSGALTQPIAKEDFALYLVRAMQLEPMTKSLTSYNLSFTDKKDITSGLEPYIYVLNMYSIITGTDKGEFQPKSNVDRAVAATMLSKATDFMKENGTSVELPEYADYDNWEAGTIVSATAGDKGVILLTLANELSGAKTVSLSSNTPIYENSMLADKSLLKAGAYARVNEDADGGAISVRLSGSVQIYTGSVVGISADAIMLSVNGVTKTMSYDRFTEVQVGGKVGDRSLIDLDAGYTNAACRVDQLGHMVAMTLTGGTHQEEGLVSSVESIATGGTTLTISGFDGQLQKYTVSTGAAVTANGLALSSATIGSSYVGCYVALRVSNDNASSVASAALDTATKYVQGAVKSTAVDSGVNTVTLTDLSTSKATTYKVASGATFYYQDAAITYGGIQKDWFVTVRISGGELAAMWAYPGSSITEGTISGITFPSGTTKQIISVTKADGSIVSFEFNLSGTLPEVKRSSKTSSLDKLRTGDVVKVTSRYNSVTLVEATPQSANLTGTITEITQTTSGVTITVELDSGAGTGTYTVGTSVSVTKSGTTISMYDLRVGYHVAMVASSDQVSSVDVDKATTASNQIAGTIIFVNTADKIITFRANDGTSEGKIVIVSVPTGTTIQDVSGGTISTTSLSKLATGDTLDIYGSYVNDQFKATLIIRK